MQLERIDILDSVGQLSVSTHTNINVPLWGLAIFILWTIAVVALLLTVRVRHLRKGGDVKDFGIPNDESLLWRLFRVQANLIENLPLYIGVVILLIVQGISGFTVNVLVGIYIFFRILHSVVHIAGADPMFRLLSLIVQLSCLIGLISLIVFGGSL
jgi:uncharacterized MAPEG superfamily protein